MPFDATDYKPEPRLLDRDPKTLTDPKERLAYLRDFLRELPPERFDMAHWTCGTAVCIGGHADALFVGSAFETTAEQTGALLGLAERDTARLFYPSSDYLQCRDPKRAANVLTHLLETGEVDWSKA